VVLKMSESPERERDNDHKNSGSEIALSEASPRYSDGDLVVPSSAGVEMPPLDLVPDASISAQVTKAASGENPFARENPW
jgi:hypothetical protein